MAKSSNFGGILITLLVLGGIGYGGYYFYAKRSVKEPEYSTVKAERRQVIQSITASGNLQTLRTVDLGAQVSGLIMDVKVDFNDQVKKGDVLVIIDPSTYQQKLEQAKADMKSTEASYAITKSDTDRSEKLFKEGLETEVNYIAQKAKLTQAESTMISRKAALTDAETNLSRTIVLAPTDAIVLNRATDPGRTVNATNSAPNLLTLVSSLDILQIDAGVSEADIGSVVEGQPVTFTVDAYPGQQFSASVKQVRNSAKNNSGVVTYSAIIDVDNTARKLRPGMTANVSIIIASRDSNTLVVPNSTLRVRIPDEIASQVTKAGASSAAPAADAPKALTPEEKSALEQQILTDSGMTGGGAITPDQVAKARQLAQGKGLTDLSFIDTAARGGRFAGGPGGPGGAGGRQGGQGGRGGGGGGRGGARGAPNVNAGGGMNVSAAPRKIYRLVTDANGKKHPEELSVTLGISDGQYTEVLNSDNMLQAGDSLISYITMPGAASQVKLTPQQQGQSPFGGQQQGQRGGGGPGGGGGGGGGRGGF